MKLRIQARAKINWTLDVVGVFPNGYHDLDMLMQSVPNFERIGDHAMNIGDECVQIVSKNLKFNDEVDKEIDEIRGTLKEMMDIALSKGSFAKIDELGLTEIY